MILYFIIYRVGRGIRNTSHLISFEFLLVKTCLLTKNKIWFQFFALCSIQIESSILSRDIFWPKGIQKKFGRKCFLSPGLHGISFESLQYNATWRNTTCSDNMIGGWPYSYRFTTLVLNFYVIGSLSWVLFTCCTSSYPDSLSPCRSPAVLSIFERFIRPKSNPVDYISIDDVRGRYNPESWEPWRPWQRPRLYYEMSSSHWLDWRILVHCQDSKRCSSWPCMAWLLSMASSRSSHIRQRTWSKHWMWGTLPRQWASSSRMTWRG